MQDWDKQQTLLLPGLQLLDELRGVGLVRLPEERHGAGEDSKEKGAILAGRPAPPLTTALTT